MSASYCVRGHYIGTDEKPEFSEWNVISRSDLERMQLDAADAFCTLCGSRTIKACERCHAAIRLTSECPHYCGGCGNPFPWTEDSLAAAREYTDLLEALTTDERTELKQTFEYLTIDTARSPVAVVKFKRFLQKIGPAAGGILQKTLETILTESAKRLLSGL